MKMNLHLLRWVLLLRRGGRPP